MTPSAQRYAVTFVAALVSAIASCGCVAANAGEQQSAIEGAGGKSVFGAASPRAELDLPAIARPASQAPAKLVVGVPLPEALARGLVVIPYRTDNLRIVPVYGQGGLKVVPRIGHLHITLDNAVWHWVDASGEPITIQFLPPGRHNVLIQLADPTHHVIDGHRVFFDIPPRRNASHRAGWK